MIDGLFNGVSIVALLGIFGAAVKWLWSAATKRADKRTEDIDAREERLTQAQEKRLVQLEASVEMMRDEMGAMSDRLAKQSSAIHVLVVKIRRDEPNAPELQLVEHLLGRDFPFAGLNSFTSE